MDKSETSNIRLKTRNEDKQNNKHNSEKKISNTDLTKKHGVSSGACEVSAVPASWDSI
jgi:NADH:ubiquinone oxidoreductase subunit